MQPTLSIYAINETFIQLDSDDRGLLNEISEYFTFDVVGAKYSPAYKNRLWDGKKRLVCYQTKRIYKGLLPYIIQFCEDREYKVDLDKELKWAFNSEPEEDLQSFIDSLQLIYKPYDFQFSSVEHCIKTSRSTLLSAVNSGKSLIIYILLRYYLKHTKDKILIIVPSISLVQQLLSDFKEYAPLFDVESETHQIFSGESKTTPKRIIISTWQSLYKMPSKYFEQFSCIICDEAHSVKAEGIKGIFEKAYGCQNKFGFTGTLDGLDYNRLIIEGLTGPVRDVVRTKELMDRNISSALDIRCIILNYSEEIRKQNKAFAFHDEMKFISTYDKRNRAIMNMINALPSGANSLILTAYKEHIKVLEKNITTLTKKKLFIVTGDTPVEEREQIRKQVESESDCIILATYGVFSTGINCKNIQYLIKATTSKSQIRVLQSIGRGLRLDGKSNKIFVLDIVDDFSWKKKKNYILKHLLERIKIYTKEEFSYSISNIKL